MGSSSPQPVTSNATSSSEPWGKQQPYLQDIFQKAQDLYNNPNQPQFYPGQTFANPDAATLAGLNTAQGNATDILTGNTGPDSAMGKFFGNTIAGVMPGIASSYIGANRTGSGLYGRAIGEGIGSALSPYYLQAPQMLSQVGAAREAIAQKPIDEAMARFNYNQNLPAAKLADYLQMVNGNFGGVTNTSSTQYLPQQNPFATILGGLTSGVGILGGTGAFGPAGYLSRMF